ncbi:HdeD family acid-resistance protein [Streptococcus dentapri]|uniref:HdeD family acid-resistance protein n=1 Tax=Streptococcus dentapri TaxID=573564 RepID=A0ABV8D0Z3_9STRE
MTTKSSKWFILLTGVLYVAVGLFFALNPVANLVSLSWLLALSFFVGTISNLVFYFQNDKEFHRGYVLFFAVISFLFACFMLIRGYVNLPILIPTALGWTMFFVAIVSLTEAFRVRKLIPFSNNFLTLAGIVKLILAIILIRNPLLASLTIIYILAVYLIYEGGRFIYVALKQM